MPAKLLDADEAYELGIEAGLRQRAEEDVQPEPATPPSSGVGIPGRKMLAFLAHAPTPRASPPAPAPAAAPAQPPTRRTPASDLTFNWKEATDAHRIRYCKVRGLAPPEAAAANTMVRPWSSNDPVERSERLRVWHMNEAWLAHLEREAAATEAARIAQLEAARMPREKTLAASPDELRAQADKQGLGGYGGLYEGIEIREPWRPLPPPRPSLTIRDQQEAARRLRRQEANQPPPQLGSDAYSQELAAAGMADATVVVAAAPQPPQPTPAAPQPHVTKASKLSATAFADLLRKKFGM